MNYRTCIILCLLALPQLSFAAVGCMAKSKRTFHYWREEGICKPLDLKTLEYVSCSCPCDRYRHDPKFGKCIQCWHYRVPINSFSDDVYPTFVALQLDGASSKRVIRSRESVILN